MGTATLSWLSSFFFILVLISTVEGLVPKAKTFQYSSDGFDHFTFLEYGNPCFPLGIYNHPFQFFFYTSTISGKDGYVLGLAMVTKSDRFVHGPYRWVWAANAGNPVPNAILKFGSDGNLVLTDAKGRVAWQTGTANKGVVDLKLLSNGNLVLLDKRGRFVWQSFNHPTDSLLVGQSLLPESKLLSRASSDDTRGLYSMGLENNSLAFYYNKPANKPLLYHVEWLMNDKVMNATLKHVSSVGTKEPQPHSDLIHLELFDNVGEKGSAYLSQQKYNSTLSFLRLESDGNLQLYTLYDINSYDKGYLDPWELTYTAMNSCYSPEKCGLLGICENSQCLTCPTRKGLRPWSQSCKPPRLPSCNVNIKNSTSIGYYKIEGVDHFLSRSQEGEGRMTIGACEMKCSRDCKCVGYFYRTDTNRCLRTTQLGTLTRPHEAFASKHLAFIKYQM